MSFGEASTRNIFGQFDLQRWLAVAQLFLGTLVCLVGGFLLSRRIAGQFGRSAGFAMSLLVGLTLAFLLYINWLGTVDRKATDPLSIVGLVIVFIGSMLLAASVPVTGYLTAFALWGPIVGSVGAGFNISRQLSHPSPTESDQTQFNSRPQDLRNAKQLELARLAAATLEAEASELDPAIDQLIVRSVDENGRPVIYGKMRGRFDIGERTKNLHIAFCPPFDTRPSVSVELSEGPDADVQIGQSIQAGVRIDVKLKTVPVEAVTLVVDIYASVENNV